MNVFSWFRKSPQRYYEVTIRSQDGDGPWSLRHGGYFGSAQQAVAGAIQDTVLRSNQSFDIEVRVIQK